MAAFPSIKGDSSKFNEGRIDTTMRTEMEGGYVNTRPRDTRPARKTFKLGFTEISDTDKQTLDAFYDTVRGGADKFTWTHPTSGITYTVRFKGPFTAKYVGIGGFHRWTIDDMELHEV